MRSSHSSHSHSHSSSRSHHSSITSHRSHSSTHSHKSSLTSHHMHHSNNMGHSSLRDRPGHHHGISDSHAFAVGRATGVNINASASGAAGAALHRSSERFNTNNSFSDNNSTENVNFENMTEEEIREFFENNPLNVGKGSFFMLIPVLIFFVIFIVMIIFMFTRFF